MSYMTPMPVIVYEDPGWQRLLPLVYLRAVFQLRCGMRDLLGRICSLTAPERPQVWCRKDLSDVVAEQVGLDVNGSFGPAALFLNGRGLWKSLPNISEAQESWVGVVGNQIACVVARGDLCVKLRPDVLLDEAQTRGALAGLRRVDVSGNVQMMTWPWHLVLANEGALLADWGSGHQVGVYGRVDAGSYLLAKESIFIGEGTRIKPCVIIDAEEGPVWIGENVTIMPHSYIQGPTFIGDGSLIQPGAVVHEGTSIGPVCKVGGEIEASILHAYSNKQHDGFLGHSYVGQWVNIAADCVNSDLKNTYGTVRVPINGYEVDSGEQFVGMFVGDHSKAGINVSFPTGSVVGFCSSVFAPVSPKFVPSFAWIDGQNVTRYDEKRGVAIGKTVMGRRKKIMGEAEERAFLAITRQALALERQPLDKELLNPVEGVV
ncbi:MAG: putative sugar nucleotidyl transferase [bacterium]|nr:putative sugar nucleotidyl transferase [bacterium]